MIYPPCRALDQYVPYCSPGGTCSFPTSITSLVLVRKFLPYLLREWQHKKYRSSYWSLLNGHGWLADRSMNWHTELMAEYKVFPAASMIHPFVAWPVHLKFGTSSVESVGLRFLITCPLRLSTVISPMFADSTNVVQSDQDLHLAIIFFSKSSPIFSKLWNCPRKFDGLWRKGVGDFDFSLNKLKSSLFVRLLGGGILGSARAPERVHPLSWEVIFHRSAIKGNESYSYNLSGPFNTPQNQHSKGWHPNNYRPKHWVGTGICYGSAKVGNLSFPFLSILSPYGNALKLLF
jgi:hypothetical protein